MANFERLIRGALASQDDSSADVRKVIYQSSRNALQKTVDNNRSLTVEAVMAQKRQLEASIRSIEAEYNPPAPATQPEPEPVPQPSPVAPAPQAVQNDPLHEIQQILEITSPQQAEPAPEVPIPAPEPVTSRQSAGQQVRPNVPVEKAEVAPAPVAVSPQVQPNIQPQPQVQPELTPQVESQGSIPSQTDVYYEENENVPIGFSKRRKKQKRFFWALIGFLVLGLLFWIGYIIFTSMISGTLLDTSENDGPKVNPNAISRQAEADNYINVIQASDMSTLITAGRGEAEIVRELNSDMIRINSVRDDQNRAEPAQPMLVRLKPGVLQQISGKRVTVEIFAKSGNSETAHFAVGCEFGNLTECGRKRFLAGSQPNASVFAFVMDEIPDINQDMFLTLSTDTTSKSAVTGKGDVLDIVYIRLSMDE